MKKTILIASLIPLSVVAETITMNSVNNSGVGDTIGIIKASTSKYGVVFSPSLHGLQPGLHGFHVHENPNCMPKKKDEKNGTRTFSR